MPDTKNNFKASEKELGKALSRVYKDLAGRGPINTEARVVNQAIFIQYKIERIPMENRLFEFLQFKTLEHEFFQFIRPSFTAVINVLMRQLHPSLNVAGLDFRVDDDTTYVLITLNKNLEKMLLSGEAKLAQYEA